MMKASTFFSRIAVITGLVSLGFTSHASTYTASQNGNWSDGTTWSTGIAPPAILSGGDFIIINSGITVTMDQDETLNNSQAILTLYGTLTSWHSLDITSGKLNGNGTIVLHSLRMGASSTSLFSGSMTLDNLYNSESNLSLQGNVIVADTLGLLAGNLNISQGASFTLIDNAVLNMGGGGFNNYQSWHQGGRINLYYTSPGISAMGIETTFANLQNITVNLPTATDRLDMGGNMTISGILSLMGGRLNMGAYNLSVSGSVFASGSGCLMAGTTSVVTVSGTAANSIAFASGSSSVAALNVNTTSAGSLTLGSDMTCLGTLNVQAGTLYLGGGQLTLQGPVSGAGYLSATGSSGLVLNGTTYSLRWANGGSTIGRLTVNVTGANSGVTMTNDMTVAGILTLTSGYLKLNGKHLTLGGTTTATAGAIYSDSVAYITLAGSAAGGMGALKFATGGDKVQNLEINTTNNSWATLASPLTVSGSLMLISGNLDLAGNDLTVQGTGSITGGSATSYILTSGTGSLRINVGAGGAGMLPVGTASYYAPLRVSNNAGSAANFNAVAHAGIYANGTSGSDVSASRQGVIVSWDLESDMTTGANAAVEAYWSQAMESAQFNSAKVYLSHYTNGAWDTYNATAAVSQSGNVWSTSRTGITSFSPFAVLSSGTSTGPNGINDVADAVAFTAYPNPARNVINVTTPDASGTLHLHDMIGNEVGTYVVSQTSSRIDISGLTPGVYFVSLDGKHTQRFVKQ